MIIPLPVIWLSDITATLSERVAEKMSRQPEEISGMYHEFRFRGLDTESMAQELSAAYRKLITIDAIDTTLHAVAILPLFDPEATGLARQLLEAIKLTGSSFSLEIIGLQESLHTALGIDAKPEAEIVKQNIAGIIPLTSTQGTRSSLILMDDYISTGASIGFNSSLLARYLSTIFSAFIENFRKVMMPLQFPGSGPGVLAFGLSKMEFDSDSVTDALINHTLVKVLGESGVTTESINTQKAADRAYRTLEGVDRFFDDFYAEEVIPLLDRKLPEREIAAEVAPALEKRINHLAEIATSFLKDRTLPLPEREASLSLLLGRDNPLLKGMHYRQECLYIDDALTSPAALFIDAYNSYARNTRMLPTPTDFPPLKKYVWDDEAGEYAESPDNTKAYNPLPELKRLKTEIIDQTAYIRCKEIEMEKLLDSLLTDPTEKPKGVNVHSNSFEIVEQPLSEKYIPSPAVTPLKSVDLRQYFSPIRQQGALGACSSFAVAAIYESIMNRLNAASGIQAEPADMSERFLFYYSNIIKDKINRGSNFHEQLEVLGQQGICPEVMCPYFMTDAKGMRKAPTTQAILAASTHRVIKARQIPLIDTGSTMDCLAANHRMLTSALSEGYPVGISLKIYNSFARKPGGFIPRPDETDIASGDEGNHAMVIVGYSETDKFYIVRNSWGEQFGDKGYCYISAAYVDDPKYNNFCCIITDTTEDGSLTEGVRDVPRVVADFGTTETRIRVATISNSLDEARIRLEALRELYETNYRYYEALFEKLSVPSVRNTLLSMTEDAQRESISRMENRRSRLIAQLPSQMARFFIRYSERIAKVTALTGVFMFIYLICCIAHIDGWLNYISLGAAAMMILVTIYTFGYYYYSRRRYRHHLKTKIDDLAARIAKRKEELATRKLHFHVAGMAFDQLHALSVSLDNTLNRLSAFNSCLRDWYETSSSNTAYPATTTEGMFIRLSSPQQIEKFYNNNLKRIIDGVDITDEFASFQPTDAGIMDLRHRIEEMLRNSIGNLLDDFDMTSYLSATEKYPFMPEAETTELFKRLNRMANVTTRHNGNGVSMNESRYVISCVPQPFINKWREVVNPNFPFPPECCYCHDQRSVTILTVRLIPQSDIAL
ncbi:MAG: C1 family peptidase [Muribaculaceae bacterium]|nr:C1 family peptidase [Muribaculaceae bacterium]